MTLYVIVIVRLKTQWRNLITDAKNAVTIIIIITRDRYILKNDELIKNDGIAVIWEIKMTEIERMFNDDMALRNIYDADPLRHNDDEYCHQIVILF